MGLLLAEMPLQLEHRMAAIDRTAHVGHHPAARRPRVDDFSAAIMHADSLGGFVCVVHCVWRSSLLIPILKEFAILGEHTRCGIKSSSSNHAADVGYSGNANG